MLSVNGDAQATIYSGMRGFNPPFSLSDCACRRSNWPSPRWYQPIGLRFPPLQAPLRRLFV